MQYGKVCIDCIQKLTEHERGKYIGTVPGAEPRENMESEQVSLDIYWDQLLEFMIHKTPEMYPVFDKALRECRTEHNDTSRWVPTSYDGSSKGVAYGLVFPRVICGDKPAVMILGVRANGDGPKVVKTLIHRDGDIVVTDKTIWSRYVASGSDGRTTEIQSRPKWEALRTLEAEGAAQAASNMQRLWDTDDEKLYDEYLRS